MKHKKIKFHLKKISKISLGTTFFVFLFCFFVIFTNFTLLNSDAKITVINKQYGRITRSNIAVYNIPDATQGQILFYPEISYFVQILEPESSNFYKIKYMDVEGYILSSDLVFISGEPMNPYPNNIGLKILANSGLHLRSTPKASDGPFNLAFSSRVKLCKEANFIF